MRSQKTYVRWLFALMLVLVTTVFVTNVSAQTSSNNNNSSSNNNNSSSNNNNNNNNNSGSYITGVSGIALDALGMVQQMRIDTSGYLSEQQLQAAIRSLPSDVATPSKMRYVSLTALEREIIRNRGVITEEMYNLAGLVRITHAFVFPESGEFVIAGPAEGWVPGPEGMNIGYRSKLPTLELQDLVVAMRAYAPGKSDTQMVGCSIDPSEEGLANFQRFVNSLGGRAPSNGAQQDQIMDGMVDSLGLHNITVYGVPANTHFAQVLVAADYRMKLIGLGLENPPVKMVKYIDKATPSGLARNALIRWYFVPNYDCVRMSEDGLAMELVGLGLKLVGEDEAVSASGVRTVAKKQGNSASLAFQKSFTQNYQKIAQTTPVYAQLRNLTDMLIVAAYMQSEDVYGQCDWKMDFFASEENFPVQNCSAPQKAESAITAVWKQNTLMTPIAGGVNIEPALALYSGETSEKESLEIAGEREAIHLNLAEGQWWWDKPVAVAEKKARKK